MKNNYDYLWIRIGDSGEYENFGSDFSALADNVFENRISSNIDWLICPRNPESYAKKHGLHYLPRVGFISELGTHVSLFWSDEDGDGPFQPLTKAEQKDLVERLKKLEKEYAETEEELMVEVIIQ